MTTAEGGAVIARDSDLLDRVRQARGHGMTSGTHQRLNSRTPQYDVTMLGFNYRMRARRQQEDYVRQHERNDNQRRIALLTDLKDTNARLADVTARLHAASEKLQPTGASNQPLPIAGETIRAQVTIVRKVGDEWRKLSADEDTIVMPGDTVEAKFSSDLQSAAIE